MYLNASQHAFRCVHPHPTSDRYPSEVRMARRKVPIRQSDLVRRFAERLRAERLARGMTQADLARLAQVTVSYVSRLESGQIAPGIDLVERIAKSMAIAVKI